MAAHTVTAPADIPALAAPTLARALLTTLAEQGDAPSLRTADDRLSLTYADAAERIRSIAAGLDALGLRRGDTLGLMMVNRPEFHLIDAAAVVLGACPFSVYNTSPPEQIGYVMGDAGNRFVIAEAKFLDTLRAAREQGAQFEQVILIDGEAEGCLTLDEVEAGGTPDFDLEAAAAAVEPEDLLTLIYTSGTTGPPKGVELTHANLMAELRMVHAAVPRPRNGRTVSFLPAAHIADRCISHYMSFMTYGDEVMCVDELPALMPAVAQHRPTFFSAVPRVWEKIKAALEAGFDGDLRAAATAKPEVGAAIRAKLGLDQATWFITGAAPTPVEVLELFDALGITICELWGMSETSGVVTTNRPDAVRFGSVGLPLEGMELRIAEDGELLVRGPLIMRGYRNKPEQTAETIDADGWLYTGDVARIDDDGYVWIVDRKKELIINAAGKNMSPANIEMQLKSAGPLIGQACVIGDRRPYNVALLVLDPDNGAGLDPNDPSVIERVQAEVDAANEKLSRVEQIKRFKLLDAEWLPGGDELTPTMKLKRKPIGAKYEAEIEALYA